MSKILFEINYNIFPEKREEYLKTIELTGRQFSDFIKYNKVQYSTKVEVY
ncbi:MAG: hypothetical protein ISS16_03220 [Ignavibacteria bacterium]|nr:hypothetical protein [Ignavibacteria bacterium]